MRIAESPRLAGGFWCFEPADDLEDVGGGLVAGLLGWGLLGSLGLRRLLLDRGRGHLCRLLYLRLILAMGLTFELPTIVLFLARMGLVTPRFLIRNIKYAVMIIMVAAAVLSPDGGGVGMVVMGGPVVGLYILSIGLAWLFGKKRTKLDEETE